MKPIIGRREWFSIPEHGVDWVRAKIDTGARTSSLHAVDIEPFQKNGADWVSFKTIDDLECEAPVRDILLRSRRKHSTIMSMISW
jgi:hypothetical protein